MIKRLASLGLALVLTGALAACGNNNSTNVGSVGVDWTGNDISVEAVADPEVKGVVCHVAYFNRSVIDRLQQGNWFEDPSYSAVDCAAAGPITVGSINTNKGGEEIFQQARSLIWKSLRVSRIYDAENNALVYLAHARELQQGSGKMSLSVVPLAGLDVTWTNGAPRGAAVAPTAPAPAGAAAGGI
jgi:CreA protein